MSDEDQDIPFDQTPPGAAERLVRLSPKVRRIVADNPGPMTFTGTCTYVVGEGDVAVIDPGPNSPAHLSALLESVGKERVRHILVTHTHRDHAAGAAALKAATGADILGCAPYPAATGEDGAGTDAAHDRTYRPDTILREGDVVAGPAYTLETLATPGHTANHLVFALAAERALFSGDHVMAWSTSVVIPPDGRMGDYMASLEKLAGRADTHYWPGHGGGVATPQRMVRALIHHRRLREAAILAELGKGPAHIPTLVSALYRGLDPRLVGAAGLSVLAHLQDLSERGLVHSDGAAGRDAVYTRG